MYKNLKVGLAKVMSLTMLSTMSFGFMPQEVGAEEIKDLLNAPLSIEAKDKILSKISPNISGLENKLDENKDPNEVVRVIVELEGKSGIEMVAKGERPGQEELNKVEESQKAVKENIKVLENTEIRHSYKNVINGLSLDIKRSEISKIESINGVLKVTEATEYNPDMNNARKQTKVEEAWKNYSLKGEGMVVAVIDSGVAYDHKDFVNPENKDKQKLNDNTIEKIKQSGVLHSDKNTQTYLSEKVPYGYNYADSNNDIVDYKPHGSHVAGIIAADGKDEELESNNAIKGVAPESQILAMKVFSSVSAESRAHSDDIVAGIDDAVSLGADVMNLSLGGPAGFQSSKDVEQKAMKRAVDAGVMVVSSASNASYSTGSFPMPQLNDIGTVGAPGICDAALSVASYENSIIVNQKVKIINKDNSEICCAAFKEQNISIKNMMDKKYEIIDCGFGQEDDFKDKDVKGKITLIKRGNLSFSEKMLNAQARGAAGVIIYNKDGDEEVISMAKDSSVKIPAIAIANSTGMKIYDALQKGEIVFIDDDITKLEEDNVSKDEFSDFTSWGCAPNLEFKPEIAAPGGKIFSTVTGGYKQLGGTSMASPHVAGASALVLQVMKETNPYISGNEKVEFVKKSLMNTSLVKMDSQNKELPVSPRRQGSGLVQVEDAIKNKVIATYNNKSSIALKEFNDNKVTFKIDLKNYGDKDVEYNLKNIGGVLTQDKDNLDSKKMIKDMILNKEDANIKFGKDKVLVKANGSESVEVTLEVGNNLSKDRFLEGYIKFESEGENTPSLTIPFMGFYGNWSNESILTNAMWEDELHPFLKAVKDAGEDISLMQQGAKTTCLVDGEAKSVLLGYTGKDENKTNIDKTKIAISPNDDKNGDSLIPALYLMRNAKKISAEVVNDKGEVVRKIGNIEDSKKKLYANATGKQVSPVNEIAWDGKIYNEETKQLEVAKEGQYTYKLTMAIDFEGAKEQTLEIPVKIDVTAPEVNILKYETLGNNEFKIYFNVKDDMSKFDDNNIIPVLINGELNEEATKQKAIYDEEKGAYYKIVKGLENDAFNEITIGAFDNAKNFGGSSTSIKIGDVAPAKIEVDGLKITTEVEPMVVNKNEIVVTGRVSRKIKSFKIGGNEVEFSKPDENGIVKFSCNLKLKQGFNTVNFIAEDFDGEVIINYGGKFVCDTINPTISITNPEVKDGKIYTNGKSQIILKGIVYDNLNNYEFYADGELIKKEITGGYTNTEINRYNFELRYDNVKNGQNINLKVIDDVGNKTEVNLIVVK